MKKKIILLLIAGGFMMLAAPVFAYQLQVEIPGQEQAGTGTGVELLRNYIIGIYRFGIGIVGVLAIIMIMVGGVVWLMAGGSPDRVKVAKDFITSALTGLVIALTSFTILYAINPELTDITGPDITNRPEADDANSQQVQQVQNCLATSSGPGQFCNLFLNPPTFVTQPGCDPLPSCISLNSPDECNSGGLCSIECHWGFDSGAQVFSCLEGN